MPTKLMYTKFGKVISIPTYQSIKLYNSKNLQQLINARNARSTVGVIATIIYYLSNTNSVIINNSLIPSEK